MTLTNLAVVCNTHVFAIWRLQLTQMHF